MPTSPTSVTTPIAAFSLAGRLMRGGAYPALHDGTITGMAEQPGLLS